MALSAFEKEAHALFALPVACPVNALGGYGPCGEVIYKAHPCGCPSVLADNAGPAEATFMSTGSIGFRIQIPDGLDVSILDHSFDNIEKREINVPSQNLWLDVDDGRVRRIASLVNPQTETNAAPQAVRVVKTGDPARAMWFGAQFAFGTLHYETAVRFALADTAAGPVLTREVMIRNTGRRRLAGRLWGYWNLHGTQRFAYNKPLWYDNALPLSNHETVVVAVVPYSDTLQIKRISGIARRLKAVAATCDYATFVGNTAASALLPDAVRRGTLLPCGAQRRMNRFASPVIAANQYTLELASGQCATLQQTLLYLADEARVRRFRKYSSAATPSFQAVAEAFKRAAADLVAHTPAPATMLTATCAAAKAASHPDFAVDLPHQPIVAHYANSAWTTVEELYEHCRAHGAKLADGIELGTRDRGQDMWPKMKQDPGRVRADLVHAMSFLYRTAEVPPGAGRRRLTLPEKLHGMFPRQFPSRWTDRSQEIMNDNRPYTDSPLWLVESIVRYVRETGDASLLAESVASASLSDPSHPVSSGMTGCSQTFTVAEVMHEIFACFARHVADSPYGLAQVLYGDWCDPVDMFGTSEIGNPRTRGQGRGSHLRLSAHVAAVAIEAADALEALERAFLPSACIAEWIQLARTLRRNIVRWGWEDTGRRGFPAGFVNVLHERRKDNRKPNYRRGETGYTLGSYLGRDYDGLQRRELVTQAFCLHALRMEHDDLAPVKDIERMTAQVFETVDKVMFSPKIGLALFAPPMANNARTRDRVGRMGVLPVGCAENGEYHHGQVMMHAYRLDVPGQADTVWKQMLPMLSAMRDESIAGPFETPCTSYVSDPADPHFGKAFYFGLSGSIDWLVDIFQKMAGATLNLHDPRKPDLIVAPVLPQAVKKTMTFRRTIHCATGPGTYRRIPLTINIAPSNGKPPAITINGKPRKRAVVERVQSHRKVVVSITI